MLVGRDRLLNGRPVVWAGDGGIVYLNRGAQRAVVEDPLGITGCIADAAGGTYHAQEVISLGLQCVHIG